MVRLATATALLATLSVAGAFAPQQPAASSVVTRSSTTSALSAATLETPPSPLTVWGEKISEIRKEQEEFRKVKLPEFGPEISAEQLGLAGADKATQLKYFEDNAMDLKQKLQDHGAIIFRGFDLMKEQEGFQAFYKAIGMNPCQDPLQAVSARPTADGKKDSAVYEAVNKESRKNFFIGKCLDMLILLGLIVYRLLKLVVNILGFDQTPPIPKVCTTNSSEPERLVLLPLSASRLPIREENS